MNKIIDIKNLSYKMHKREILKSINFYIPENSIAIFIGNNGAGKTTVIKSILNLIPYKQGTILLNQLNALSAKSRVGVGYLHEEELKINNISAQRFLYEQAKFCGITTNIINKKIEHYAQLFGISRDRLSMQVNYLSRGLKRILMIINAFITGTKLIVLDEPTEFLDPKSRNALNKAILDAWHEKKTIFLSSHSLSDINKIINWVVVIDDGVIKYCGPKHATKDLSSFFKSYWNVTTKY